MLSEEIIPDYKVRENGYFLKTEAVVLLFFILSAIKTICMIIFIFHDTDGLYGGV
jgi:hypothetical protein